MKKDLRNGVFFSIGKDAFSGVGQQSKGLPQQPVTAWLLRHVLRAYAPARGLLFGPHPAFFGFVAEVGLAGGFHGLLAKIET